jgi:Ca2+-binding RTX toxin-like protein
VTGTYDGTTTTIASDASSDTMVLTCGANQVLVNGVLPTGSGGTCTSKLVVLGNDGDDVIDIRGLSSSSFNGITLDAGGGNDRVDGTAWTVGNTSTISIAGGAGDDVIYPHGSDLVRAGPGNDTLSDLSPDTQLFDGESGTDTYTFDFSVFGSTPLDFNLTQGGLVLQLSGSSTLQRWSSVEVVDIGLNEANNALRAGGFEGIVKANGAGGNDAMTGGPGADTLIGGPGDDALEGGPGIDRVEGGDGSDLVRVRDGLADSVDCGAAPDIAVTDQVDALAGCESVDAAPTPVPPDTTKPAVVFKKAVFKSGTIKVPVSCPAELRCLGTATLAAQGKVTGKKRVVKLGTLIVVLDNGKAKTLKLRPTKAQKKAVLVLDGAKLRIRYDVMDAGGNVVKGTTKVGLKLPA